MELPRIADSGKPLEEYLRDKPGNPRDLVEEDARLGSPVLKLFSCLREGPILERAAGLAYTENGTWTTVRQAIGREYKIRAGMMHTLLASATHGELERRGNFERFFREIEEKPKFLNYFRQLWLELVSGENGSLEGFKRMQRYDPLLEEVISRKARVKEEMPDDEEFGGPDLDSKIACRLHLSGAYGAWKVYALLKERQDDMDLAEGIGL